MKKILLLVILASLGWQAYEKYGRDARDSSAAPGHALGAQARFQDARDIDIRSPIHSTFTCDGRAYCSQMTSCAEAKYFLAHCPNVNMDGNQDGIPCEKQWCSE
ncbi:excalibur calcium-binding domain-containing protein [Massilia sp. BHUDP2]|uniref:excalibur calcium-binding domain-containing protein n=1 Tax=Massilia sp. BHUDP2 TaxID=3034505 RepID=UPI0039066108